METIGKRIVEMRKLRYMTQQELADGTGLSLATIKNLENSRSEPRSDTMMRLAEALNVTADFLATGNTGGPDSDGISPRSRALGASFLSLRRMSQGQLEAAEEMLRVLADMDEDDFQNTKR